MLVCESYESDNLAVVWSDVSLESAHNVNDHNYSIVCYIK